MLPCITIVSQYDSAVIFKNFFKKHFTNAFLLQYSSDIKENV